MKKKGTNRRDFIRHSGYATLGIIATGCFSAASDPQSSNDTIVKGEEWKINNMARLNENQEERLRILEEAKATIEKIRKTRIKLKVVNASGSVMKNTPILLEQVRSSFEWGCSYGNKYNDYDDYELLKGEHIAKLFNAVTAKCYWDERWHQPIEHEEGKRIYDVFEREVKWGVENGLKVKGHPLVWTVRKALPQWLDTYSYEEQLNILEKHVKSLIKKGGSRVEKWDLCNEMLWEPSLRNYKNRNWPHIETIDEILTYLEPVVKWAKETNPKAVYSLNEYGLVADFNKNISAQQQRERYIDLVKEMEKRNCKPDALGIQSHVGGWYTCSQFKNALDELAVCNLPLQITEFWAKSKDNPAYELQTEEQREKSLLQYVEDMYTIAFGHPSVNHFTYWGKEFLDEYGAGNAMYETLYHLIRNRWMTKETLRTNEEGLIETQGFLGDYLIRHGEKNYKVQSRHILVKEGDVNEFTLKF